jgi:alpha-ketoglutarate-dependent taurine dioxygenase
VLTLSPELLLQKGRFSTGQKLPLVIQPTQDGVDLCAWIANYGRSLQDELYRHGAILFRGFSLFTANDFHKFVQVAAREPLAYKERSSPRTEIDKNIYTSTDYPADQSIFPHNENSYAVSFPSKLFFWCEHPADEGGETPLVDTRNVYQLVAPPIRFKFEEKGWMLVRNFTGRFGLSWQKAFQTEDRASVEEYCLRSDIQWEWLSEDRLRTRQVRPAVGIHPVTKEKVWFNHAAFFHVTTINASLRTKLCAEYAEEDLPNNTYYGDGSPIPDGVVEALRQAYMKEMVLFPWQAGDTIVVDNMLTAHARRPFKGRRRILFAMSEPLSWPEIESA